MFELSKRAKHISISIKPKLGVRVAVPYGASFEKAETIVQSKITWIQRHLARIKLLEQKYDEFSSYPDIMNRDEARKKLVKRLKELAEQFGFTFSKVVIRQQKTRWGSCSRSNAISLNIKLTHLPDKLIDYVLLHELVHTRIKNHSNAFWKELERFTGKVKPYRVLLKTYSLGLFDEW